MSLEVFGQFTIVGTAAEIALTKAAFTEGTPAIPMAIPNNMIPKNPVRIEYHTPQEFVADGRIIPYSKSPRFPKGRAAWGYRISARLLWCNSKVAARFPALMRHVNRHETGHDVAADYLSPNPEKRTELMAECLQDQDGKHPTQWSTPAYEDSTEGFADGFAMAISGIEGFYDYDVFCPKAKLARLLTITLRDDVPAPEPEPEPPPPPLPVPDPEIARLQNLLKDIGPLAEQIKVKANG